MRDLHGKRVLITGGARGIGLALARAFSAAGAEVLLADLDGAAAEAAAQAIREGGGRGRGYALDVTDPQSVDELRRRVHVDGGPIDVLVNNAGVVFGGAFLDVPLEHHLKTLAVNARGPIVVTRAFLPELLERPQAHVVNISSASGLVGLPFGSSYAASKWALSGFGDSLRQELELQGHGGVRVTTVCPSYVATGLFDGARPPRTTRMLDPDGLAALVLRAVRRDRPWLLTPWLIKITPLIRAVLPTRMSDRIAALFGASTSMRGWQGRRPSA